MRIWHATLALVLGAPALAEPAPLAGDVAKWRSTHGEAVVAQLADMLAIDSVAASPAGLRRQADMLVTALAARGFTARLLDGKGGPPVVFGALATPGARRTVVFYAHYDGQPVVPAQWATPPFEPVMRDTAGKTVAWRGAKLDPEWRLHGRGEEEAGSPHLQSVLAANKALLAGNLWLIGDGPVHQSRQPLVSFGARGVMGLDMTIYGPARALHDGHYGNWAPNPAAMAVSLVAAMRDDDGNILIPGFGDDARPLSAAEAAAIAALPPVEADLRRSLALGRSEGKDGLTLSTMRPALNVRGLGAGQTGAAAANAIPTQAAVSLDFRLVPGQTPAGVRRKVEAFLTARGWTITDREPDAAARAASPRLVRLEWEMGYPALRADMTTPVARAVIAAAQSATTTPVGVLPMMGGSVPLHMFDTVFGAPIIGLPIANHDNNQHAANENLRLQNLWDGVGAYAAMIGGLDW